MSTFSAFDHACMAEALRLAERGAWTTRPNPRVGCVIAAAQRVVGRGWHRQAGGAHAEVFALAEAGPDARGSTAYVTLEPCAHHGRTPPCVDALIAAGIARAVVAVRDPFPQVDGRGIERLRAAGISVDVGLLEAAARELNVGFFARIERHRPWLRVKLAASLDGRTALANGDSKWITGAAARADVQRWRARACAILTSSATVRTDDPQLTARVEASIPPPLRLVVCGRSSLPESAALLRDGLAPVLLVYPQSQGVPNIDGVDTHALPDAADGVSLTALLHELAARGINEVHSECGPRLAGALLQAGLVDELLLYQSPILLGDRGRPLLMLDELRSMQERTTLRCIEQRQVGNDVRSRWQLERGVREPAERAQNRPALGAACVG